MEPVHDDRATNRSGPSSPTIMRPNTPSSCSSSSSPPPTNSGLPKPKLALLTPPTTPSSPSTTYLSLSPPLSSRSSSSLSTPPAAPRRQPIRSSSTVGRSQLNAVTENTLNDSTPAGAAAKLSQPHLPHEQGET